MSLTLKYLHSNPSNLSFKIDDHPELYLLASTYKWWFIMNELCKFSILILEKICTHSVSYV